MNDALCVFCQDIFRDNLPKDVNDIQSMQERRRHHSSVAELRECGLRFCRLCAQLWASTSELEQNLWLEAESNAGVQGACHSHKGVEDNRTQILYTIYCRSTGSTFFIQIESMVFGRDWRQEIAVYFQPCPKPEHLDLTALKPRGPIDSTFSPASIAQMKEWLGVCLRNHRRCHDCYDESWLPSRLLYVGQQSDDTPLVLRQQSEIPRPTRYLTLSHVWGTKQTLQLTMARLSEFSTGVSLSSFPATYRDAILLTRALKIDYIWIDSICIIQDSASDWRQECTTMASVYKNGLINILALHAKDDDGGCFALRDTNLFKPLVVQIGWPGFDYDTWISTKTSSNDATNSPLLKRGWVLQESVLSARMLYFGKQQLSWECREVEVSESYSPIPRSISTHMLYETRNFQGSKGSFQIDDLLSCWNELVCRYSKTSLSHAEDKLVAFSGIAKTFQRVVERSSESDWTYLAGLWRPQLELQMLWFPYGFNGSKPQTTRPSKYRAPSWSWASVDGYINPQPGISGLIDQAKPPLLEILNAHVEPAGDDPFLQVASAYLRLRSFLFRLDLACQRMPRVSLTWDVEDLTQDPKDLVYLMPIMVNLGGYSGRAITVRGIIVQQVNEQFKRTGTFEFRCSPREEALDRCKGLDEITLMQDMMTKLYKGGSLASYSYKGSFPVLDDEKDWNNMWTKHTITLI